MSLLKRQWRIAIFLFVSLLSIAGFYAVRQALGSSTTIAISQVPLTITTSTRPQVLIAITNSESMDGSTLTYCNGTSDPNAACSNGFSSTYTTRGGALMTGSGMVTGLSGSSSPVNYPVPSGFTPPVTGATTAGTLVPYTSTVSGNYVDNSPSRLNVAKAGILNVLNTYLPTTDFSLMSYSVSGTAKYSTWVYYMSPSGGFSFTNTINSSTFNSSTTSPLNTVLNPCYGATSGSTLYSNCSSIASVAGVSVSTITSNIYMTVSNTSDDATINDILYTVGYSPAFMQYGTVTKNNTTSLSSYKTGSVSVCYGSTVPSSNNLGCLTPTNAGFLPGLLSSSPQVMYVQRGWGYNGSQSYTAGKVNVSMTTLGSSPTSSAVTTAYNSFSTYLQPETNSTSTSEIKSSAGQSPIYALLNSAASAFPSVSSGSCTPQKYVVLVTDGLPTQDHSGNFWPPAGTLSAQNFGVTANFNSDGSLNTSTTNDQALLDAVSQIKTLASSGIKTYVIGLGAGVTPAQNPTAASSLTAMAVAGGTGVYYPATNASAFSSALGSILVQIQKGSYDQASASLNSTSLSANSMTYLASFNPSTSPNSDWTGNLSAYSLGTGSSLNVSSTATWQAQTQIDTFSSNSAWSSSRIIATWDGINSKGVPFEWPSSSVTANINSTQQSQLQPSDSKGNLRLNYLRGDKSNEIQNGGAFRNRTHLLGDIVNSAPAYVGQANGPYTSTSSYLTYISTTKSRPATIYTGANDGMLHAIDATTGNERFAFIPNGVFSNLYQLTSSGYSHLYFVDGSPQIGDAQFSDNSWHTILTAGLGGGGQSVYALDVSTPQNITSEAALASAVLWEFTDSADLGYTYSKPVVAKVSLTASNFAVFFGNGYNSSNNNAVLYAVNPQTGAQLAKINLCAQVANVCNASLPQGLSSVVAVNSSGLTGSAVDRIYAGDLQGNLWAINVSNSNPAQWTVRLLFTAKDSSSNPQPITTTPVVSLALGYPSTPGLMISFGTGQLLSSNDLTNTNTQAFYGIYDNFSSTALTPSNLLQQTETLVTTSSSGFTSTVVTSSNYNWKSPNPPNNCVVGTNCPTYYGWYFNLSFIGAGSRLVTDPILYDGNILFTTYMPSTSQCSAGGSSYLMGVYYATGGSPLTALFDVNGNGVVNSSDNYNGSVVTGISLGSFYSSSPSVILANLSGVNGYLLAGGGGGGTATGCTNSYLASCKGLSFSTSWFWRGWWQIQ